VGLKQISAWRTGIQGSTGVGTHTTGARTEEPTGERWVSDCVGIGIHEEITGEIVEAMDELATGRVGDSKEDTVETIDELATGRIGDSKEDTVETMDELATGRVGDSKEDIVETMDELATGRVGDSMEETETMDELATGRVGDRKEGTEKRNGPSSVGGLNLERKALDLFLVVWWDMLTIG